MRSLPLSPAIRVSPLTSNVSGCLPITRIDDLRDKVPTARSGGLDSRQSSQGSLTLPLGQRLVDLEDFRDVFKRFDERRNLPRISIHRVLASIEGGERQTHVLAKPID